MENSIRKMKNFQYITFWRKIIHDEPTPEEDDVYLALNIEINTILISEVYDISYV